MTSAGCTLLAALALFVSAGLGAEASAQDPIEAASEVGPVRAVVRLTPT